MNDHHRLVKTKEQVDVDVYLGYIQSPSLWCGPTKNGSPNRSSHSVILSIVLSNDFQCHCARYNGIKKTMDSNEKIKNRDD